MAMQQRNEDMAAIRSKDTKPEMVVLKTGHICPKIKHNKAK
jgi:G:T-mismatch repair DNA endonuclease (very short patch repair protein)